MRYFTCLSDLLETPKTNEQQRREFADQQILHRTAKISAPKSNCQ